ncbi:MAG: hypothetical protein ACOYLK_16300 [Sphingomonas sp.]
MRQRPYLREQIRRGKTTLRPSADGAELLLAQITSDNTATNLLLARIGIALDRGTALALETRWISWVAAMS